MLLDTEQISLLRLNVLENPEFAHMQQEMGITELPYIIVYFNGDRDHNIHGKGDPETAKQIIEEMERIAPKAIGFEYRPSGPIGTDGRPIRPDGFEGPAAQLEAHVDPRTGQVVPNVYPPPQEEQPDARVEKIDFKRVGDWMHERPENSPGVINDLTYSDVFENDAWARPIETPGEVVSYDVYPMPS